MDISKYIIVSAKDRQSSFPDTFHLPLNKELASLKIGSLVKICIEPINKITWHATLTDDTMTKEYAATGERFWVIITSIDGNKITGKIDNDLLFTKYHELKYPDTISFELKNIFEVGK